MSALGFLVAQTAIALWSRGLLLFLIMTSSSYAMGLGNCGRDLTQFRMQVWHAEDGLPLDTVLAIAQTPDGFVWTGTESGLARFDGHEFTTVNLRQAGADISPWVESLIVDHDGRLVVGAGAGGLVAMKDFRSPPKLLFAWPGMTEALTVAGNGDIWFSPQGGGLMVIEQSTGELRKVSEDEQTITVLSPRTAGGVWIGYSEGGFTHSTGSAPVMVDHALANLRVEAVLETSDGTLWVSSREGLYRINNGEIDHEPNDIPYITTMVEDEAGAVWAGTSGGGLLRYCNGTRQQMTQDDGLPFDLIQQVMMDSSGDIWVATSSGGIGHLSAGAALPITSRQGLPDKPVLPIIEDSAGVLWVGTFGGGFAWIDDADITVFDEERGLINNWVFAFAEAPDGSMWVGSRGGVTRFVDGRPIRTLTEADGLSANAVVSLHHDGNELWIGTIDGLSSFDGHLVKNYEPTTGDFGSHIISLLKDRNGTLWIGTRGNGLYRLKGGVIERPDEWPDSTGSMIVDIYERADGILWIATNNGLIRLGPNGIDRIAGEVFPDPVILSIIEDLYGQLWLSTNRGVLRVDPEVLERLATGVDAAGRPTWRHFTRADGMPMTKLNGGFEPSVWRDANGRIWYPTAKGIAVFDPAWIESQQIIPTVILTGIDVQGNHHSVATLVDVAARPAFIEFDFSAPEFRFPLLLEYRYRLLGLHDGWHSTEISEALYHRPGPGAYTFEVQARVGQDRPWSPSARLDITVQRHLLESPWFWAASVLLLVIAITLALGRWAKVRSRRQAQVEQAQRLEAIGLLAGGIAHDFNNVLATIMSGIEVIELDTPEYFPFKEDAAAVRSAAEKGAALTRQLLTFGRQQSGSTTWQNLASELRSMQDFLHRILKSSIELNLVIEDEDSEVLMDRIHLQQILLNLITNARDAMPNGGRVTITLAASANNVRLTVRDEGMGMDEKTRRRIFEPFFSTKNQDEGTGLGLSVTHGIVKSAGGEIEVESAPGKGTAFYITLPARR